MSANYCNCPNCQTVNCPNGEPSEPDMMPDKMTMKAAPFGSVERLREEIERWRDSNRRFRNEMEHQHQRAQILEESNAELQALCDLRYKAHVRAIKMWQDAHPEHELVWPDHADLMVWLLSELEEEQQRGILLRDMLEQP